MSSIVIRSSYGLNIGKTCHCHKCGAEFQDKATLDISQATRLDDLPALIEREFKRHIPDIPVGWSCNGRDKSGAVIVYCPNH